MKKSRLLALVLTGALTLSLLAGCNSKPQPAASGGNDPAPGQPAKGVELIVVTSYGGDDGHRKDYEAAVKSYEEATGNTIMDASGTSNEEWKAKVLTDFQTGTESDVLFFFSGADAEPFIQAGKVVDIAGVATKRG